MLKLNDKLLRFNFDGVYIYVVKERPKSDPSIPTLNNVPYSVILSIDKTKNFCQLSTPHENIRMFSDIERLQSEIFWAKIIIGRWKFIFMKLLALLMLFFFNHSKGKPQIICRKFCFRDQLQNFCCNKHLSKWSNFTKDLSFSELWLSKQFLPALINAVYLNSSKMIMIGICHLPCYRLKEWWNHCPVLNLGQYQSLVIRHIDKFGLRTLIFFSAMDPFLGALKGLFLSFSIFLLIYQSYKIMAIRSTSTKSKSRWIQGRYQSLSSLLLTVLQRAPS